MICYQERSIREKEAGTRCQVPLNFYKQTNTYLQIVNVVVE